MAVLAGGTALTRPTTEYIGRSAATIWHKKGRIRGLFHIWRL